MTTSFDDLSLRCHPKRKEVVEKTWTIKSKRMIDLSLYKGHALLSLNE